MRLKVLSAERRQFCLGLNVLSLGINKNEIFDTAANFPYWKQTENMETICGKRYYSNQNVINYDILSIYWRQSFYFYKEYVQIQE